MHSKGDNKGDARMSKPHDAICRCEMCMKSKLSPQDTETHLKSLHATMVDRRNPDSPDRPLMKAMTAHGIIQAGTTVNMMELTGIQQEQLPVHNEDQNIQPEEIVVDARWKNKFQEPAKSGRDASVFGALGTLAVAPNTDSNELIIPKMNALNVPAGFLASYGAALHRVDLPVDIDEVEHEDLRTLYLVEYNFDPDYIEQYVLKLEGGGGLFVETHPFPHIFTPLASDCAGALILGKDLKNGQFKFAAFQIPFGYSLTIKSNIIHGDSFFTGPYAIALTETELADSVLFKRGTVSRDIQHVTQEHVEAPMNFLPSLMEHKLFNTFMLNTLVDKIKHEGPPSNDPRFFNKLPQVVIVRLMAEGIPGAVEECVDRLKNK